MKKSNLIAATGGVGALSSLRSYAKWRILNDMFEEVRKREMGGKSDYLILVVDHAALKVFSSCC